LLNQEDALGKLCVPVNFDKSLHRQFLSNLAILSTLTLALLYMLLLYSVVVSV